MTTYYRGWLQKIDKKPKYAKYDEFQIEEYYYYSEKELKEILSKSDLKYFKDFGIVDAVNDERMLGILNKLYESYSYLLSNPGFNMQILFEIINDENGIRYGK